ncbi:MAG: hypothetical protein Q4C16_04025 [Eubacteriales bacterium]|nr:hypothetical protein [Eubacteriales bacterium]
MKIPGAEKIKERLPATNGKKTGGKKRKSGKKKARREERIGMSGVVYKYTFREKIMYMVDAWLSRGTLSTIIFLLAVTGALGFVIGILVMHFGGVDVSLRRSLWDTFNHIIDPGVLSGDSGSPLFIVLMLLATVIGLLFLAMLIGLINDGIQRRVANLSKGLEPVIEQNHIVILGFNESTFIILGELIEACRNQKNRRNVAVVMDELPKTEMEDRIRIEFPKTGNLKVVCRSGSIINSTDLHRCSILSCKSIIIAAHEDYETIKGILACTRILEHAEESGTYITSVIYGKENEHAAKIAGNDTSGEEEVFSVKNDRLELLMMEKTISKIMTHTCRQNGLSRVFIELFNFTDNEFYVASPEMDPGLYKKAVGKSIRQINRFIGDAIAVGIIQEDGHPLIADPNTVVLKKGSRLILLQNDDEPVTLIKERTTRFTPPSATYEAEASRILIFGSNEKLPLVLREMCEYLKPGSIIFLAEDPEELSRHIDDEIIEEMIEKDIDAAVKIQRLDPVNEKMPVPGNNDRVADVHQYVYEMLDECRPGYVLILVPDSMSDDLADEQALKMLLYCKNYKEKNPDADFGITCEMRSIANQQLAQDSMASDFVISRNIASLMMSQIAETRELGEVFELLLSSEGFEVYIKPAKYYFSTEQGKAIDFYSVQDAVAEKGEIFLGYKKGTQDGNEIIMNPVKLKDGKKTSMVFSDEDLLLVLAEEMEIRK